ncbi:hypothetical protein BC351_14880 [Paenibacillus ferrarius]|uniref:Uncharacterized protein n=1 Tax=Paenibacillus ferrarius TaxID=1469647 RepID=A0A1V4HRA2_9BACL|nr:hypothetical protein [Paenibacillus ferrarius]OPH61224.1 hypothetical protein BC351_14880 [Paenibacillus ferrarius]
MQIIRKDIPLWTEKHLCFMQNHADSFGIFYTSEQVEQERRNIDNNNATRRCGDNVLCYELFNDDGEYVVDITLTELEVNKHELSILVLMSILGVVTQVW